MLRHLAPTVVYMEESLSGSRGENIEMIKGWVGQVVLVVGADGGAMGGLVDSEDEEDGDDKADKQSKMWWESSDMIGLGKGIEIVDASKVREDWERRVLDRD